LSAAAAAALASTAWGLSCLIDDTVAIYGKKTIVLTGKSYLRWRIYIDPNTLAMENNNTFYFVAALTA
jgi:hypothetical protein